MERILGNRLGYWALLGGLIGSAIVAQNFPLYLIFDVKFVFVSVFYLAIIRLFNYKKAIASVLIISIIGFFLGIHSAFLLLNIVEVLFVGGLYRWRGRDLLTWDVLFWVVIWIPSYYLFIHTSDLIVDELALLTLFQVLINGWISAFFADLLSDYLPRLPFFRKIFTKRKPLYFGRIISHITIIAAVIPMFCFTIINGWYQESLMIESTTTEITSSKSRIKEEITTMDRDEIQNLILGSIVQKAYLKEMFDNLTNQNNMLIYAVDNQNNIFAYSSSNHETDENFKLLDNGYVSKISNDIALWLPKENNNILDWSHGYFYSTLSIEDMNIFTIIPIQEKMGTIARQLTIYFVTILLLFAVAGAFAWLCKRILSGSLLHLTKMTSDLPKRVENSEKYSYSGSDVYEFDSLGKNFEQVAKKLRQMFIETKQVNSLLTERTKELVASKDELYRLAHFDALTGLPNRYTFTDDIKDILTNYHESNLECAIVFIDLDKFKQVNDLLGHSGGDRLLQVIAERLRVFGDHHNKIKAYRLGGDEFVLIISDTTYLETNNLCIELAEQIKIPVLIQGEPLEISASMGASFYPSDGEDIEKVITNADTAMYRIKESGRNGVSLFSHEEG
ncbi:GGDEF domain-containing protein [Aquibacillus halophilus]|nr:GGDEF domain-containing protein [Aquibacillus halophilus]